MIPAHFSPWANHLWQSTLCAAGAWLLTLALRKNRAAVRYWLWFAASVKFLVPFSLLVSLGDRFAWRTSSAAAQPQWTYMVGEIGLPFAAVPHAVPAAAASIGPRIESLLLVIWLSGFAVILALWSWRWFRVWAAGRSATRLVLTLPIPVLSSPSQLEPGIFGIFRPVLLLPQGIAERLTTGQFDAIIAHEMCHVRRRDNLTAAIHMLVETIFWFHPLVWWMGVRMVNERERACDEEVLQSGVEPQTYAEGILGVCKLCVESPLVCVSGVTGSNLKKRIVLILTQSSASELGVFKKALLSTAAVAALAGPFIFGLATAKQTRAASQDQNTAAAPVINEVSVKPEPPGDPMAPHMFHFGLMPNSTFTAEGLTLKALIQEAYGAESDQVSGGPDWAGSQKYDINAKLDPPSQKLSLTQMQRFNQQVMQPILADRFKLAIHHETRYIPVYVLVVAESGSKLHEATPGNTYPDGLKLPDGRPAGAPIMQMFPGELIAQDLPTQFLAHVLSGQLDHMVLDRTGLTGNYDFTLKYALGPNQPMRGIDGSPMPPPASVFAPDPSGPSIFDAVQDQLGLKLEPQQAPVDVIVIDHAEEPPQD